MVVLPTLIAPSPAATGSASLAKRDVRPVRLGTPAICLIVFLILGFFIGVVPWVIRYIYLRRTGARWHGCFQRVEDDTPGTAQEHDELPEQPYSTGDVKLSMMAPVAKHVAGRH